MPPWPLILEAGRDVASKQQEHGLKVARSWPLNNQKQQWNSWARGLVMALVGDAEWKYTKKLVLGAITRLRLEGLPALGYFALFEGPRQAEAQALLGDFARSTAVWSRADDTWGRAPLSHPQLEQVVANVRELCSQVTDPDPLEDVAGMMDFAAFQRLTSQS